MLNLKKILRRSKIKYIRNNAKYYKVKLTRGKFGNFGLNSYDYIILAFSPIDAILRLQRKGIYKNVIFSNKPINMNIAKLKVKEVGTKNKKKNTYYF